MGGDRELSNCHRNYCYFTFFVLFIMIDFSSSQTIKEINRDYHGDIFIISGDPVSCDPSLCSEGERFAAPVSGHPCKCQCDPSKQIFREDIQQCVRDLDDCPLVTFTRTYISETIPVVSLPTAGQLVHPGAHLNLENRHNVLNQTCRVESDLMMSNEGWASIDEKSVFALIVDGSRSFLQWVGNDHNRRQLEQKLVLIRFNCQLKPRHGSLEVAPYRPCAAVRIGWVPGSSLGLLKIQGNGYNDGNIGSGNQAKGTSGYLIIGLSIGVLGLTYVLSLMIYLRSKRTDSLKHRNDKNSSNQRNQFSSSSNHNLHRGSVNFFGGDASLNQTGSSSLERGGEGNLSTKVKSFTLSMDRVDYGEIKSELNPIVASDFKHSRKKQPKESNQNEDNFAETSSHDRNSFDHTYLPPSSSVPVSSSIISSSINNPTSSVSSSTPLLTFPSTSLPFLSISSSSSSSPSPASSPSQQLSSLSNINSTNHHHHTPSSLNSLQARVKEKSAQFNGQLYGQSSVQTVSDLSSQPFRRPARLSRRDLANAPKLLDPEALTSPSPTAIEFLSRLREVISSARGRMRAFRFKPTLLVIPEDDYFIPEFESKYRSIISTTTIDSSMDAKSLLDSESELQLNKNDLINSLLSQEALTLYHQSYQQDLPHNFQQTHQPLSLPMAVSNVAQSNSSESIHQFTSNNKQITAFDSSHRISDSPKFKQTSIKENAISDSELSKHPSFQQQHEHQLSSSSSSFSSICRKNSGSSMMITAWGDDQASKVSRREIVGRLAEEMVTVKDDKLNSNENGKNEQIDFNSEPDSLNDLSDINENLFETDANHDNNRNTSFEETISSENLANLSNEVEKKLAQRSIVPLPEVVSDDEIGINNKMKSRADGNKANSSNHHSNHSSYNNHNHSKEDSRLSQLVADLKHFTRKRKQIKTSKSLPMVSDNNWMLQPVASMSLRLPSSYRSSLSSSASKHALIGSRSMRNSINGDTNKPNPNRTGKYNNKNNKLTNKKPKSDGMSHVITIQEGRYLNFNNHSTSDEEPNSNGNEALSTRFPLETWSLSSEPSNGSSSPNYNPNNNNNCCINIDIDIIEDKNYEQQSILDAVTRDGDEMFITFAGNKFDSNGNEGEVGYISRYNLIKKYIDDPSIFTDCNKDGCDDEQVGKLGKMEDDRSLSSTINGNFTEKNHTSRNQMIINSLSDSSASSSTLSSEPSSPSNNHYYSASNVINSTVTMNQWKSIDSKHFQSSPQSLPLLSSLSSIRSSSSTNLDPLDLCSSDDGLSSASVSSIMFMESPKQGRRKSVDRRLINQSISITERDNQLNHGNNNNDINSSIMVVRGGDNRGNWNNKINQPTNNGIRLNRQGQIEKRHFPNGLMTIA